MPFQGFGFALWHSGSFRALEEKLQSLIDAGYSHAEVEPSGLDVYLGGRVNPVQLSRLVDVLDKYRDQLGYTLHLPGQVNLFDLADQEMHERLLRSGLEVGKAIGAESMAYHPGWRPPPPAGTSLPMFELMTRERDILLPLADEVAQWGGHIAIETWIDTSYAGYSYALWPEMLATQVETSDHPAVGVCLDVMHLYISSRWYGFDFIQGVARLAPLTTHFHIGDTYGIMDFAGREDPALGQGDLALPPGWGDIPLDELFGQFDFPKCSVFMLELRPRFIAHLDEMLSECKRLAGLRSTP
ncbi:MAG: sugar phosphate isomerase/epimerase [Gammaproteobacteria bacterium]|nr:sugar phosphate isomerase/epimerase [Gammaproteobacteria bacterium]